MISPNPPKTRAENLAWRVNVLRKARVDHTFRAVIKERFHRNLLFAFNGFFYTYDPRKRPLHNLPFITWDYQDETLLELMIAIREGYDKLLEKSRDMGASWMVLLTILWFWLDPKGGTDFLLGSRIEDYVDKKGDMRTLVEKVRYALYRLPVWLRPKGYTKKKHDNYMRLINPETGSVISGESNNANFSTGGRYAAVLMDEFAKWESTDESAWTATGDATKCRIPVSTPFGAGGQYYRLVTSGNISKTRLHWSLHPEKALGISCLWPPPNEDDKAELKEAWKPREVLTSPWYEKECRRRSSSEIAQELDINYIGAGNPVFDGKCGESLMFYLSAPDRPCGFLKLDLERLSASTVELPPDPESWEAHLVLYEEYNEDDEYTTGWDIVAGIEGGDYLFGTVYNRITQDVVAVYWSQYDEIIAAKVIYIVQNVYSPEKESSDAPWCGIEAWPGPGLATFDECVRLGVTNLFMAPRYDVVNGGVSYKKGWVTSTASKAELIAGIKKYLTRREGKINSHRIIGELLSFVRTKTGKAKAKEGCHDDAVMSFGIALQVDEIAPLDGDRSEKRKKQLILANANSLATATGEDERELFKINEDLTLAGRCLAAHQARVEELQEASEFY